MGGTARTLGGALVGEGFEFHPGLETFGEAPRFDNTKDGLSGPEAEVGVFRLKHVGDGFQCLFG
jgi:hypothetical protein